MAQGRTVAYPPVPRPAAVEMFELLHAACERGALNRAEDADLLARTRAVLDRVLAPVRSQPPAESGHANPGRR